METQQIIPSVELDNNMIRISNSTAGGETATLLVPVESVDEFCEAVYWARKQFLTRQNDALRMAEDGDGKPMRPTTSAIEKSSAH